MNKRVAADVKVTVTIRDGRKSTYSAKDIQEMLDNKSMYTDADNLPKWLFVAGAVDRVPGFPKTFKKVWALLEEILASSGHVEINVASDDRWNNKIKIAIDRTMLVALLDRAAENALKNDDPLLANAIYDEVDRS